MKTEAKKPTHVKPVFYAHTFLELKEIARDHGYNLCLNGSLNRDMDLIAIPWVSDPSDMKAMVQAFCDYLDGEIMKDHASYDKYLPGGRKSFVINLNRGGYSGKDFQTFTEDQQWYLDISITPKL